MPASTPSALARREKVVAAVVIAVSVLVAGVVLLTVCRSLKPKEKAEVYLDLKSEQGSTCWEANVFATTYDPFYKWITSSSIATAFSVGNSNSSTASVVHATAAYQAASVWRVSGNRKEDNSTAFFNSPDPRILRGVIHQNRTNWLWRMNIYWGLGVRLCLGKNVGECMWTAPVAAVNGSFGILLVGVPYRMPGNEPSPVAYGRYLTNFACNARTNTCMGIGEQVGNNEGGTIYMQNLEVCNMTSPIFYVPDTVSYLAFPSLQCACSGRVCIIGPNLTYTNHSEKVGLFEFNTLACQWSKSFWHWGNRQEAEDSKLLQSYCFKLNGAVAFRISLPKLVTSNISEVDSDTLVQMQNITLCVENWLETNDPYNYTLGATICERAELISGSLESRLTPQNELVSQLVRDKVLTKKKVDSVSCGADAGQAAMEEHICVQPLKRLDTLQTSLELAEVANIYHFGEQMWEKGASKRQEVYMGIMTTLLTILVTIAGMMCRQLQEAETWVIEHIPWLGKWTKTAVVRTLLRVGVLLCFTMFNLFNLWNSIDDNKLERGLATAGTFFQSSEDITFLVTTTSSIEVTPTWIGFYAFCSGMGVLLVAVTVYIYHSMSRLGGRTVTLQILPDEHVVARVGSVEEGGLGRLIPVEELLVEKAA